MGQTCYILGVSRHTLKTYLRDGRLKFIKFTNGHSIKIPMGSIEYFIAHYLTPSQTEGEDYKEEVRARLQEMELANVKKHGISPIFLEHH